MNDTQVKRHRPRISTTLSPYTFSVLVQVSKEQGFDKTGPTLDYIVHDWVGLKRASLQAAAPVEAETVPA
jgi:hypothetical protein